MIKKCALFILLVWFATHTMERPSGTPAEQAAQRFHANIEQRFRPELTTILKESQPFTMVSKLKAHYTKHQSMIPSMREMCTSFMLALKYPSAAFGAKFADLAPSSSEIEQAWDKEWTHTQLLCGLNDCEVVLKRLNLELEVTKKCFTLSEHYAFADVEKNLREKSRLITYAKEFLNNHNDLELLQKNPLQLLGNREYQKKYNDTLRRLYSPQTIERDVQNMHPNNLPLLFQLCHIDLPQQEFEQLLSFLVSGEQKLLINKMFNGETLLDYVTRNKLANYVEIIKKYGGKPYLTKPILKFSFDSNNPKIPNKPNKGVKKSVSFSSDDKTLPQEKYLA